MKNTYSKIASVNEFETKKDFNLYILAVKYGKLINSLLDNGYLVFDEEDKLIDAKFIFNFMESPTVGLYYHYPKSDGIKHFCGTIININCSQKGIFVNETSQSIKKMFSKYKIVNPKDIKKLKLN